MKSNTSHEPGDECSKNSVTAWILLAKTGDLNAVDKLCRRYFDDLASIARKLFGTFSRIVADEDDIANTVLECLCRKMTEGSFPDLQDRNDLWRLMLHITENEVHSQIRQNSRKKRGSGRVFNMTDLQASIRNRYEPADRSEPLAMQRFVAFTEICHHLVNALEDRSHKEIALMKLKGHSNREISKQLGYSSRTVDRKVRIIRELWIGIYEESGFDLDDLQRACTDSE